MLKEKIKKLKRDDQVTLILIINLIILIVVLICFIFVIANENKLTVEESETVEVQSEDKDEDEEVKVKDVEDCEKYAQAKFEKIQNAFDKALPGIVCWGDSLTEGSMCDTNYPTILSEIIQENITDKFSIYNYFDESWQEALNEEDYCLEPVEVVNLGIGGETSATICSRNGAIDMVNAYTITIPAECERIQLGIDFAKGGVAQPLRLGDVGVNPVTIEGIEGTLSIEQNSAFEYECTYYFTRSEPGESVEVPEGATIHCYAEDKYLDYWMIIFMGTNGGYTDVADLIEQHKAMIDQQESEKYIILGMHYGNPETLDEIDKEMEKEFGDHYISLHEFFTTDDLSDYGYSLTGYDMELQEKGYCPASLMYEGLHFNEKGYTIISDLIYKRMIKLGYFDSISELLKIDLTNPVVNEQE